MSFDPSTTCDICGELLRFHGVECEKEEKKADCGLCKDTGWAQNGTFCSCPEGLYMDHLSRMEEERTAPRTTLSALLSEFPFR